MEFSMNETRLVLLKRFLIRSVHEHFSRIQIIVINDIIAARNRRLVFENKNKNRNKLVLCFKVYSSFCETSNRLYLDD